MTMTHAKYMYGLLWDHITLRILILQDSTFAGFGPFFLFPSFLTPVGIPPYLDNKGSEYEQVFVLFFCFFFELFCHPIVLLLFFSPNMLFSQFSFFFSSVLDDVQHNPHQQHTILKINTHKNTRTHTHNTHKKKHTRKKHTHTPL